MTLALMSAFPAALAGNWPVLTVKMVAVPLLMVWQLILLISCLLSGELGQRLREP